MSSTEIQQQKEEIRKILENDREMWKEAREKAKERHDAIERYKKKERLEKASFENRRNEQEIWRKLRVEKLRLDQVLHHKEQREFHIKQAEYHAKIHGKMQEELVNI